jgi:hypothetical protein
MESFGLDARRGNSVWILDWFLEGYSLVGLVKAVGSK